MRSSKHYMKAFLFPIMNTEERFKEFELIPGVYIVDLKNKDLFVQKPIKLTSEKRTLGLLLIENELTNTDYGDIENLLEFISMYLFFKTKKNVYLDEYNSILFYDVVVSKKAPLKVTLSKSKDLYDEYGMIASSIKKFEDGGDRKNLLTRENLKAIKLSSKYVTRYHKLYNAQIPPLDTSPLGSSMVSFRGAFSSEMMDHPKYILLFSAFEALFSISNHELVFRLSHNLAWFLFPNPTDYVCRIEIVNQFKRLYEYRSRLVHGENVEVKATIYDTALELYCSVIMKLVEEYDLIDVFLDKQKHKNFIKYLEVGYLSFSKK